MLFNNELYTQLWRENYLPDHEFFLHVDVQFSQVRGATEIPAKVVLRVERETRQRLAFTFNAYKYMSTHKWRYIHWWRWKGRQGNLPKADVLKKTRSYQLLIPSLHCSIWCQSWLESFWRTCRVMRPAYRARWVWTELASQTAADTAWQTIGRLKGVFSHIHV